MIGLLNRGPSLVIIDLLENKKINKKNKLKSYFLKSEEAKAVEKRLKLNILTNYIKLDKGKFFLKEKAKKIIIFHYLIKSFFRLKSDV